MRTDGVITENPRMASAGRNVRGSCVVVHGLHVLDELRIQPSMRELAAILGMMLLLAAFKIFEPRNEEMDRMTSKYSCNQSGLAKAFRDTGHEELRKYAR